MGVELWEVEVEEVKKYKDDMVCRTFRLVRELPWDRHKMVEVCILAAKRARENAVRLNTIPKKIRKKLSTPIEQRCVHILQQSVPFTAETIMA